MEPEFTLPTAQPRISRQPSHSSAARPKGILKNPSHDGRDGGPGNLTWDEQNLNYNEDNKEAKMKITEPKTPYVRYDAETDTVMDLDKIPGFELGAADPSSTSGDPSSSSNSGVSSSSGHSSRHSSFTSTPTRSVSGSLPGSRRSSDSGEKKVDIVLDENLPSGGLPSTSDEEDESKMDEATRIKHAIFKNMRKSHYGNEAEAMKRAAQLLAAEDEEAIVQDPEEAEAEKDLVAENTSANVAIGQSNGV